MHFLDKRVRVICEELKRLKVRQSFVIDSWKYREGFFVRPEDAEVFDGPQAGEEQAGL